MRPISGPSDHCPMDPAKYRELVELKQKEIVDTPPRLIEVEPYRVPARSSDLAAELLAEALTRRLTGGELIILFEEASLHDLGRTAHRLRLERSDPDKVTYIVDRNVTYTNLCDGEDYLLNLGEILEKCRTVDAAGCNQILLQGGHHPQKRLDYYEDMLRGIKENWPSIWIHGFSPNEIQHFARLNGTEVLTVLEKLKTAGLDSVSGDGAEILNDRVRQILSPGKTMSGEWIQIMETAHLVGLPTTVTMIFAHIETYAERVEHFLRVRESQDKTGGYTAFIPWTFQPHGKSLMNDPALRKQVESMGYQGSTDYLRTLAISRIALDNFPNLQASWVTQGKAVGQLTLYYGANDLGSLMVEESIVSPAGLSHPLTRADLDQMITGAGFKPALRDNGFNIIS